MGSGRAACPLPQGGIHRSNYIYHPSAVSFAHSWDDVDQEWGLGLQEGDSLGPAAGPCSVQLSLPLWLRFTSLS